jgi:hypothetical protein
LNTKINVSYVTDLVIPYSLYYKGMYILILFRKIVAVLRNIRITFVHYVGKREGFLLSVLVVHMIVSSGLMEYWKEIRNARCSSNTAYRFSCPN